MTLLEKLTQIRERAERATKVVAWYPHTEDGTVRGPYHRWFKVSSGAPNPNMAPESDDVEFCAMAMNSMPRLLAALEVSLSRLKDCCTCENTNQCWACRSLADITRILVAP